MKNYDHKKIEKKWQKEWDKSQVYKTSDNVTLPKQYILDMFPYPSGEGLHIGHPRGYIATDVYSRKKRMEGFNVLHPMGWDAFGLPAENFAIKNKIHPRVAVEKNIARFKEQLSIIGLDYDWSREINTTDPAFYKWTQWIFLQMFKKGLAYESNEPVNWCPTDKTVLANEDVEPDGTCERCGTKVEKRPMRQWVLKITDYADRMLVDLDKLPKWPDGVKEAQRNWIGKSEGAEIDFPVPGQPEHPIKIFTTRPDTLYGATFIAVSAGLAKDWISMGWKASPEVETYIMQTLDEQLTRDFKEKEKTGIATGFSVTNPATKELIPVWIANYVMSDVGTGAIMAVPAHDERDFEFAKKYNLPIKRVIEQKFLSTDSLVKDELPIIYRNAICAVIRNPKDGKYLCSVWRDIHMHGFITGGIEKGEDIIQGAIREIYEETGYKNIKLVSNPEIAIHSFFFHRKKNENRHARFQYLFFDLIDEEQDPISEEESAIHDLVWKSKDELKNFFSVIEGEFVLNILDNMPYLYTGEGILGNSGEFNGMNSEEAKIKITEAVGGKLKSTYKIKDWVFSRQRYWGEPIPIIHCEKCGVVAVPEKDLPVPLPEVKNYEPKGTGDSPLANIAEWLNVACPTCGGAGKRETNTMPQWAGSSWYYLRYIDPSNDKKLIDPKKEKEWIPVDVYVGGDHATRHLIYARFWHKFLFDIGVVSTEEPFPRLEFLGFILAPDGRKMSKRWGNVINPDDIVKQFGADAFRLYEMFIGPFENTVPWNTNGLVGTYRLIEKIWIISQKEFLSQSNKSVAGLLHKTIKKVTEDIESFKFNTSVSTIMIFINEVVKDGISQEDFKTFLQIFAPFAPHMTEELWYELGEKKSIHLSSWPKWDKKKVIDESIKIAVQVNGKVRSEILISNDMNEEEIKNLALVDKVIIPWVKDKQIKRVIYVKGRLVSIVV